MIIKNQKYLLLFLLVLNCTEKKEGQKIPAIKTISVSNVPIQIPAKNQLVIAAVKKFGPDISPTYEKAVCTELVIQVLEKVQPLNETDKKRIRIITTENIQDLLANNSDLPKGVYYALRENGSGIPIFDRSKVQEGDFVQFWTETWGHCGIIRSIDPLNNEMELYSSFPSTNGYGIQKFAIPYHTYFVRLK